MSFKRASLEPKSTVFPSADVVKNFPDSLSDTFSDVSSPPPITKRITATTDMTKATVPMLIPMMEYLLSTLDMMFLFFFSFCLLL